MLASNDYIELLTSFPPRPITSEEELELTQNMIDQLLDQGKLSQDEKDYLNVLGALVYEYEQQQEPIPDIYGVELLKSLIEDNGLRQKDLVSIFKTESIVSDILNGKRELTKRHIEELAEFFHVSPAVFFPIN
ncbi:MAG TPA: transcriptional regulator [Planktothrix sp. UBA8407]|jgi:Predicted transcription regulator containing HTH domain|nr:transcriptional regulator [Planktothrix sp. UBA8407]HBK23363.1 transcriptional regulator [Planktothrix sp. UBA10369]